MANETFRTNPREELLLAEVCNEPQWIVWPDVEHEAAWADEELTRELQAAERAVHPSR